jgi:hypothetical protein
LYYPAAWIFPAASFRENVSQIFDNRPYVDVPTYAARPEAVTDIKIKRCRSREQFMSEQACPNLNWMEREPIWIGDNHVDFAMARSGVCWSFPRNNTSIVRWTIWKVEMTS